MNIFKSREKRIIDRDRETTNAENFLFLMKKEQISLFSFPFFMYIFVNSPPSPQPLFKPSSIFTMDKFQLMLYIINAVVLV